MCWFLMGGLFKEQKYVLAQTSTVIENVRRFEQGKFLQKQKTRSNPSADELLRVFNISKKLYS